MRDFTYHASTEVVFGRDVHRRVGELAKRYGAGKALVLYGGKSALESGLLEEVENDLQEASVEPVSFGGVVPNPRLSHVRRAIDLGRQEKVDFILAIGGGSVIDTAKAAALGLADEGDVWDFYLKKRTPERALPVGSVLTIAAAGSESSNSTVITNEQGWLKRGLRDDIVRPKFALMNPELTMTLPWFQTACGCVDIVMHALERYFEPEPDAELRDLMTEALIRTVMHNSRILRSDPENYEARAEIMWAGTLAHNDLLGDMNTGDWACHQMEHELSGMFDVAHGAGLSALWGSWAVYVHENALPRFDSLATNVFDSYTDFVHLDSTALTGIHAMEDWFRSIDMPTRVSDLEIGLTEDRVRELADKCTFGGKRTIGKIQELGKEDIENIYRMAR